MTIVNSKDLKKCNFCRQLISSSKIVVSRGNPFASFMIIGEAPGALEDDLGIPFVGRSGKVLDTLLNSVGFDPQKDVYISNVVKIRPPKNRRPSKKEIISNMPWLEQQIDLVDPSVIALLGSTAVKAVLGIKTGMTDLRGHWLENNGRWFMPMFHPSYLLRNPSKAPGSVVELTRGDLLAVRKRVIKYNRTPDMSGLETNRGQES